MLRLFDEKTPNEEEFDPRHYLLRYISKNKELPSRLAQCNRDNKQIQALLNALTEGNLTHPVFNDKECPIYLIYLYLEKLIDVNQFSTGYLYLTVLMQYTDKQTIHVNFENNKRKNQNIINFLSNDITSVETINLNKKFIDRVIGRLSIWGYLSNQSSKDSFRKKLTECLASKKGCDAWMFAVPVQRDDLMKSISYDSVTMPVLTIGGIDYYVFPSVSILNDIHDMVNNSERSMRIVPIFGTIKESTLYEDFHKNGYHPLSLHYEYVKSNPKIIHESDSGPLPIALHDLCSHVFYGSLFNNNDYNFIFKALIPLVQKMQRDEIKGSNSIFNNLITHLINNLNDLGIANPDAYLNLTSEKRLFRYLENELSLVRAIGNEAAFEAAVEAALYIYRDLCQNLIDDEIMNGYKNYLDEIIKIIKEKLSIIFRRNEQRSNQNDNKNFVKSKIDILTKELSAPSDQLREKLNSAISNDPYLCMKIIVALVQNNPDVNLHDNILFPPLAPITERLMDHIIETYVDKSLLQEMHTIKPTK